MDLELVALLERLKNLRREKAEINQEEHDVQTEALPLLKRVDPDKKGVPVKVDGEDFEAFYQQNKTPVYWDKASMIPWLQRKGLWTRVSTEVLDEAKLEAEIRAGNISRRELRQFMMEGDPPSPFIRFEKAKRKARYVIRRKRK